MFICVCKAVSDKRIRRAAEEGATSVRDLTRSLGLGTCCGKCVPAARDLLEAVVAERPLKLADLAATLVPVAATV